MSNMEHQEFESVYRAFRQTAYRKKYETALIYGRRRISYGVLLTRIEYAYNTFRQMGVEPGDRVCLWLPNCPDLLTSFYGLSRLGAIPVLAHPVSSARELSMQMRAVGAEALITTPDRYADYSAVYGELPPGSLILCRPEQDLVGKEKQAYLEARRNIEELKGYALEELLKENRYASGEIPFGDREQCAVVLFGTSCFLQAHSIVYTPDELQNTVEMFWHHRERVASVYIENSFASEGGFLAAHSAFCMGKTVLWSAGDPLPLLKKRQPDFLVATEEFFWRFRREVSYFKGKWSNLQGGYQIGKELTPLMKKYGSRAFEQAGGRGMLMASPVPLKVKKETLYFVGDFGVRPADLEREITRICGIAKCRCVIEGGSLRLKVLPDGMDAVKQLGRGIISCCRREMNPCHLPRSVEFCSLL